MLCHVPVDIKLICIWEAAVMHGYPCNRLRSSRALPAVSSPSCCIWRLVWQSLLCGGCTGADPAAECCALAATAAGRNGAGSAQGCAMRPPSSIP